MTRIPISFATCAAMATVAFAGLVAAQGQRNAPATPMEMLAVIERHELWLMTNGEEGARADLRGISLEGYVPPARGQLLISGLVLRDVNLSQADIRFARLQGIDLSGSNLSNAEFDQSDLRGARMDESNLTDANLSDADLTGATLRGANLRDTILRDANLSGADLTDARCLSAEQVQEAIIDSGTRLPPTEACESDA